MWKLSAVFVAIILSNVGGYKFDALTVGELALNLVHSEFRSNGLLRLTYSINNTDNSLVLELRRNEMTLPAGLVSQRRTTDGVKRQLLSDEVSCLFTGTAIWDERRKARAALDVCNGMNGYGYIFSDQSRYVVRPVDENRSGLGSSFAVGRRVRRSTATGDVDLDDGGDVRRSSSTDMTNLAEGKRVRVEVVLVADNDVLHFYGYKTESYLLSLMNTVSTLFKDGSLVDTVDISLSELIILEENDVDLAVTANGHMSLKNFCKWQMSATKETATRGHHHISVLLTRKDICEQDGQDCHVLGLANFQGACSETRNCAIVQDTGLQTVVSLAHEIGHLLGMKHDGDGNGCLTDSHSYIMAAKLGEPNGLHSKWSDCSREYLTAFLESESASCLKKVSQLSTNHVGHQQKDAGKLPGEVFTREEQCEIMHSRGAKPCHYSGNTTCGVIWCSTPTKQRCITYGVKWAEGTSCGSEKWCMNGQCVSKTNKKLPPVNGSWSGWSEFGSCSRTCGGGVRSAHRKCDNPSPRNGGKYCQGERHLYKSCSLEACPRGSLSFREAQCAQFNNKAVRVGGRLLLTTWKPKHVTKKGQECRLLCYNNDISVLVEMTPVVKDGTHCGEKDKGICIRGICVRTGCNHILGSNKDYDQCGVCGGDGSSCDVVSGTYKAKNRGFNTVVEVPKGAVNIQVDQPSFSYRDGTYLALQNSKGSYYFNNFYIVTQARTYQAAGTVVKYSGASSSPEQIVAKGPLDDQLLVKVLNLRANPPVVHFSYAVPKASYRIQNNTSAWQGDAPLQQQYVWVYERKWSTCSKQCEGVQFRRVTCKGAQTNEVVSNLLCNGIRKPTEHSRQCNTECPTSWVVRTKSRCSVSCGGGISTRLVFCVQMIGTPEEKRVSDSKCSKPRPSDVIQCHTNPCPAWKASDWNECSNRCGHGMQQRTVKCTSADSDVSVSGCNPRQKPVSVRSCSDLTCPVWVVQNWTTCSHSCGGGLQSGSIVCRSQGGQDILPVFCQHIRKSQSSRSCNEHNCSQWRASSWSQCSKKCGSGIKTRTVNCMYNNRNVDSLLCASLSKPLQSMSCVSSNECGQWRVGQWRQCPGRCVRGVQTRLIWCQDRQGKRLPFAGCNRNTQPSVVRSCRAMCPVWQSFSWSQCTVSCGGGLQRRSVRCIDDVSGQVLHTSACSQTIKPSVVQQCGVSSCHAWHASDWQTCSCDGVQSRDVVCTDAGGERVDDSECSDLERPASDQSCIIDQAVCSNSHWLKTNWSDCSVDCGRGERQRDVYCVDSRGNRVADTECRGRRPRDRRTCIVKYGCGQWVTGKWDKCPTNCGPRVRQRSIKCVARDGSLATTCDPSSKPTDSRPCRQKC